jgi:hypothetical protein
MLAGLVQELGCEGDRDDHRAVVVGDDDVARHHDGVATGHGNIHRVGEDVGLGVKVWGRAAQPQSQTQVLGLAEVPDAPVDDDAHATTSGEVGQHHLAEDAAAQVTAGVHHDDVPGLGVVEHVAVQLLLRVGVLVDLVQVLPLRQELQGEGRAGHAHPRRPGHRPADVGTADSELVELAARGGASDCG